MEINWQLILFIYVILAFALYGIFHWIEEVLGNDKLSLKNIELNSIQRQEVRISLDQKGSSVAISSSSNLLQKNAIEKSKSDLDAIN